MWARFVRGSAAIWIGTVSFGFLSRHREFAPITTDGWMLWTATGLAAVLLLVELVAMLDKLGD